MLAPDVPAACVIVSLNLTGSQTPVLELVSLLPMTRMEAWSRFAEVFRVLALEHPKLVQVLEAQGFVVKQVLADKTED